MQEKMSFLLYVVQSTDNVCNVCTKYAGMKGKKSSEKDRLKSKYLKNLLTYSPKHLHFVNTHLCSRWWARWCACVQTCLECSLLRRWPDSNPDSVWKPRHFSKKAGGKKICLCAEPGWCRPPWGIGVCKKCPDLNQNSFLRKWALVEGYGGWIGALK